MIQIFDNFFDTENDLKFVTNVCYNGKFHFGEVDRPETPPTGLIYEIQDNSQLWDLVENQIERKILTVKNKQIYRMYVNCFAPSENPYFHRDGYSGYTFLFYPIVTWEIDEGGETQFFVNNEIKGVLPIPNRAVLFSADILHRATSFRSKHRFTLAVKYNDY